MGSLRIIIVYFSLIYNVVVTAKTDTRYTAVINKQASEAAKALRTLTLQTEGQKLELRNIAIDLQESLNETSQVLRALLPRVPTENNTKVIANSALILGTLASDIQRIAPEDSTQLQGVLALSVEKIKDIGVQLDNELAEPNPSLTNQIKRVHIALIFTLVKLKHRVKLFDKTNAQLKPEILKRIRNLMDVVDVLPEEEKVTEEMLRQMLQHLSLVKSKDIDTLKKWVELNTNHKDVHKVEEVTEELSKLYGGLNRGVVKGMAVSYAKGMLKSGLRKTAKHLETLAKITTTVKDGRELIRNAMFDDVAVAGAFTEMIGSVVKIVD